MRVEPLDVTDFARIEALADEARRAEPIDLLINNAGIYGPRVTPYDSVDYAAWAGSAAREHHGAGEGDARCFAATSPRAR